MSEFDAMDNRHRRRVKPDGSIIDLLAARGSHDLDAGRVVSLNPLMVELRDGEEVKVDGYFRTSGRPPANAAVAVVRKGGFVLLLGEVVLL